MVCSDAGQHPTFPIPKFGTREIECGKCANHCEVICVYRDKDIIDSWGNRCDKGAVKTVA